jgi:hypothetical protein
MDFFKTFFRRRRLEVFHGTEDCRDGNRFLVLAVVVAADSRADGYIEEIAEDGKTGGFGGLDIRSADGSGSVGVVNHQGAACAQAFTKERGLAFRGLLDVAADVCVGGGEMLGEIRGFARAWQADEDYGFRHFFNFGGRAPCRTAP